MLYFLRNSNFLIIYILSWIAEVLVIFNSGLTVWIFRDTRKGGVRESRTNATAPTSSVMGNTNAAIRTSSKGNNDVPSSGNSILGAARTSGMHNSSSYDRGQKGSFDDDYNIDVDPIVEMKTNRVSAV